MDGIMNLYKPRRGVSGALECVCCFEQECFGCALTSPSIGVCLVCGQDVRIGDSYNWHGDDPVHWDCVNEFEGVEENDAL